MFNHNYNEDPWHVRYQQEREMHLKAREELEKALMLIEVKENQESELTDLLSEEKREKK